MKCEKCNEDHDGSFGSGRFCSRRCANSKTMTDEKKVKIKEGLKKFHALRQPKPIKILTCEVCGNTFEKWKRIKNGFKVKCRDCTRKVPHTKKIINSIRDMSKRTTCKIIKRMNIGCSICDWKDEVCDIHHIIPKKLGGDNSDSNLVILCPNHHRLAQKRKISITELKTLSIDILYPDWRIYYNKR